MPRILQVENLSVSYSRSPPVLQNLFLDVYEGEALGIVGGNGSGKSSLALALLGVIPELFPGKVHGKAQLNGSNLLGMPLSERLDLLGYAFQDAEAQILFGKVRDVIGIEDLANNCLGQAMDILSVRQILDREPDQLSGGEAQKVALLAALRRNPKIAIFDEASSALDPHMQRNFCDLIMLICQDGRSALLLGQRTDILDQYCSRLAVLDGTAPLNATRSDVDFDLSATTSASGFSVNRLSVRSSQRRSNRLGPIDLEVRAGENIAILGPNGSGKTSLLLALLGFLRPRDRVYFKWQGKETYSKRPPWHGFISPVFQSPIAQITGSTVEEEIEIGGDGQASRSELAKIVEAFPFLGLDRDPLELSFGQQRMMVTVCAFLSRKPLVLIDEPELGLDQSNLEWVKSWLTKNRTTRHRTIVFSTHNLALAAENSDRCLLMSNGRIIGESTALSASELEKWYFRELALDA